MVAGEQSVRGELKHADDIILDVQMQQQQQMMQQQQQQQALMAQPTGYRSNNPFAPMAPQHTAMPTMPSPQPQAVIPQTPAPQPTFTQPTFTPAEPPKPAPQPKDDGKYSNLANLLANREAGIDTFGNFGNMREFRSSFRSSRY
jgi:epsin